MLEQILDTRQMVKRSLKKWKDNETLQKVLDSRQLGLKLIANVTYGYTSANFSGRMPCVEVIYSSEDNIIFSLDSLWQYTPRLIADCRQHS